MSATRTALESTTVLDVEHALVEIDHLLHRKRTTPELLRERYASMTEWPRTLTTDLVLRRRTDDRSPSVSRAHGSFVGPSSCPAPIPNYAIHDAHGREIARVDLAWPTLGVFLEFDGRVKYGAQARGRERDGLRAPREGTRVAHLRGTGWRCIRLVWADLYRPDETAARIRRLFRTEAA